MMQIERVLVSDPLDAVVIDLLTAADVTVDVRVGLSEECLCQIIPVSAPAFILSAANSNPCPPLSRLI